MDKKKLNNEIILCRPAVRKAKVIVIRKLIKKIKILKSCKNEAMKEKKLNKANNLINRIQIMKKLRVDDVTKFALRNEDYEDILKHSSKNLEAIAMASLAKHDAIKKMVTKIREQIPNWKTELPILLNFKDKKGIRKTIQKTAVKKSSVQPTIKDKQEKLLKISAKKSKKIEIEPVIQNDISENSDSDSSESENQDVEETLENHQIEKVDDPFFIEKKIVVPKLLKDELQNEKVTEKAVKTNYQKKNSKSTFHNVPFRAKKNLNEETKNQKEEVLHPSWAAKKVQLIKPFEGKKIKFSDD